MGFTNKNVSFGHLSLLKMFNFIHLTLTYILEDPLGGNSGSQSDNTDFGSFFPVSLLHKALNNVHIFTQKIPKNYIKVYISFKKSTLLYIFFTLFS